MSNPQHHHRKSRNRNVWVFSELNRDLRPEQIARIITAAGLEQARLEVEAKADGHEHGPNGLEADHA